MKVNVAYFAAIGLITVQIGAMFWMLDRIGDLASRRSDDDPSKSPQKARD